MTSRHFSSNAHLKGQNGNRWGCEKYNEFYFPQRELRQEAGRGGDLKPDIKAGKLLSRQMWER